MTFLGKSSTKKGVSLPIDMLVILAIAVIILIAVVAVFMGVWNPFSTNQQQRANFNKACQVLINTGCPASYAISSDSDLCKQAKGLVIGANDDCTTKKDDIRSGCGCPGVSGATTTIVAGPPSVPP